MENSNWSIISTVAAIATVIWTCIYFFSYENLESLHKAEKDNMEAKFENEKVGYANEISKLQQRIENLEIDIEKLKNTNILYYECLSKNPSLLPVLKKKIEDQILTQKKSDTINISNKTLPNSDVTKILDDNARIYKGNTYINKSINIIIGLHDINVSGEATINLTLGLKSTQQEKVTTGSSFRYSINGKKFILIIKAINFIRGYIEIEIL